MSFRARITLFLCLSRTSKQWAPLNESPNSTRTSRIFVDLACRWPSVQSSSTNSWPPFFAHLVTGTYDRADFHRALLSDSYGSVVTCFCRISCGIRSPNVVRKYFPLCVVTWSQNKGALNRRFWRNQRSEQTDLWRTVNARVLHA